MALEEMCGFYKMPFMRRPAFDVLSFGRSIEKQCENFKDPYKLELPPIQNPIFANVEQTTTEIEELDIDHGTTTLGFTYQGGVLLAVDSRATQKNYVGSNSMKKVVEINNFLLGTLAGSAADCIYWDRVLAKECRLYELNNKKRITVAAASKRMADVARKFMGMGLSMGMMLAGYEKTGPQLYYIDYLGACMRGEKFVVGSGSAHARGILDTEYRWDLTDDEAQELGKRAICNATFRDSYSGGIVRVYRMTANGFIHVSNHDCADLRDQYEKLKHDKYKKPKCKLTSTLM